MVSLTVLLFTLELQCPPKPLKEKQPAVQGARDIPKNTLLTQSYDWTFKDPRDGQRYKVQYYDGQDWWVENIRYALNGGIAPFGEKDSVARYGYLYTWEQVMQGNSLSDNICPKGWHVPSWEEWQVFAQKLEAPIGYLNYRYNQDSLLYQKLEDLNFFGPYSWAGAYLPHEQAHKGATQALCLWTSSSRTGTEAHHLLFQLEDPVLGYFSNKGIAQSCRCLRNRSN